MLQPENGLGIKTWLDDEYDIALMQLAPFLIQVVIQNVPDVKPALKQIKNHLTRILLEDWDPSSLDLLQNRENIRSPTPVSESSETSGSN